MSAGLVLVCKSQHPLADVVVDVRFAICCVTKHWREPGIAKCGQLKYVQSDMCLI